MRFSDVGSGGLLADAVGSIIALTDAMGTVQTSCTYQPFGMTTASGAVSGNSYQFTGRENDGTGLFYYRARYYHPTLQRFISEDPLEFAAGDVNLYAYIFNDPIDWNDPTGEIAPWLLGGLVGAGVDLGLQLLQNGGDIGCVSWGSVAVSGLAGAALGAVGPGGPIFGRARYGAPRWWGNQNIGNTRFGWSWHQGRNWFGPHGGTPYTTGHWHGFFGNPQLMIPGPSHAANMAFGIGGGAVGGVSGNSMSGRGKCGGGAPSGSGATSANGGGFGGAGASALW